ncbi:MAG: peptide chain release factor 2 [Candidatus Gribaldobacteria bacterium]|nr:peptide chain release factor 2 [Candidatus Gribaldobacteria bacterium]
MNKDSFPKIEFLELRLLNLEKNTKVKGINQEIKELDARINQLDFWDKEDKPAILQQQFNGLKNKKNLLDIFKKELADLVELSALVDADTPENHQVNEKLGLLEDEFEDLEKQLILTEKYDGKGTILTIKAGAGGRDAEDWASILWRMYQRYLERKDWHFSVLSQQYSDGVSVESRIGIKEINLEIKEPFSYGLLKNENGVHRLVRVSPFSAKQLRHTSFASVEVMPKLDNLDLKDLEIKPEELKIDFFRSSGPGGQNVNKRETAVRITHLPTGLIASSQVERTQLANRKIAFNLLLAKICFFKERERKIEVSNISGDRKIVSFGSQIRSYTLYPYKLIKDHRTYFETNKVEEVLDGDIDNFIKAEISL